MKRHDCLELLAGWMDEHWLSVTSLSANYREWADVWRQGANFYALNLGLCVPFALGVSLAFPKRKVIALDSDGSLLIDTSSLVTVADAKPSNLVIIVFDNESYSRMGSTATSRSADLAAIASGAGIPFTHTVRSLEEFEAAVKPALERSQVSLIVAKVEAGKVTVQHDHSRSHGHAMTEAFLDALRRHPDYRPSRSTVPDPV